jgi:uncharacterized protein
MRGEGAATEGELLTIAEPIAVVQDAFEGVRKEFHLGVGELRAAIDAVLAGFGDGDGERLGLVLRSLWCHSLMEQETWEGLWRRVLRDVAAEQAERQALEADRSRGDAAASKDVGESRSTVADRVLPQQVREPSRPMSGPVAAGFSPLPVQVPEVVDELDEFELRSVGPVSRRLMSYGWRSIRCLRADGPRTVVDVEATVREVARQGRYVGPVMRRRRVNHGRLVLLVDQQGSMVPFHRWSRDLVETAMADSRLAGVSAFYFYNVPQEFVYLDEHLTKPIELSQVLAGIDQETTVLLVSDGGAARGRRERMRIRETTRFVGKVRSRTGLVGWLNPMPMDRWERSAAEILAYLLPMGSMDREGFGRVLDEVMGKRPMGSGLDGGGGL